MNLVQAIVQMLLTSGLGARTLARLLKKANDTGVSAIEIVKQSPEDLVREFNLRPGVAEALPDMRGQAEEITALLEEYQVSLISAYDDCYPERLTKVLDNKAPPVLFAQGNTDILDYPAVTFSGSRRATDSILRTVADLASVLARDGANVISGFAPGSDLTAHAAALEVGGATTIVLAEGILHFRPIQEIARLMSSDNYLVISEFLPTAPWSIGGAMQRNLTMAGLADVIALAQPGPTGGTYEMGQVALRHNLPLMVLRDEDSVLPPGSADQFVRRGAIDLDVTDISCLQDMLDLIVKIDPASPGDGEE
jgi:DNA processing protein